MKGFFFGILLFLFACTAVAQTTTTAGAWTTGSNWSTGTAPNTGGLSANVIINKAMTFNSGSITGWGSTTITITTGGSLTVTGNLDLTGSGANITVQSGGSLSVSGSTSVTNGARITIAGGATPGSASFAALAANSDGKVTINSGASVTATSLTTSSNNDAIIDNQGTLTINGNVSSSGVVTNSGTLQVNGSYTQNNSGNSTTSSGTFNVTVNATANGLIQLNPGTSSTMTVNGTLTVDANPWIIVGTNVSACNSVITNYANLVVKTNLVLTGSGDVTVNQNGRMVVFGNVSRSGGSGNLMTINCGGQVYVHGNINLGSGGGNTVANNNGAGSPTGSNGSPVIGLYVNGTVTAQNITGTVGTRSQLQTNDLPFYNWIGNIPANPLPVKLLSFEIREQTAEGLLLGWITAMEKDFEYFLIERAGTDLNFQSIGQVESKGGLEVTTAYSFFDGQAKSGKNYYRLKSVNLDGSFEYSRVIVADWQGENRGASIYPNPVTNRTCTISLNAVTTTPAYLRMFDVAGYEIFQTELRSTTTDISFPADLPEGVYVATITSGMARKVIRIVIK